MNQLLDNFDDVVDRHFEYVEQEYWQSDYHVDRHDCVEDIRHIQGVDEYEQGHTE